MTGGRTPPRSRLCSRSPNSTATSCRAPSRTRSEEHTSELQSQSNLVCRLPLEKKTTGPIFPANASAKPCGNGPYQAGMMATATRWPPASNSYAYRIRVAPFTFLATEIFSPVASGDVQARERSDAAAGALQPKGSATDAAADMRAADAQCEHAPSGAGELYPEDAPSAGESLFFLK